MATAIDHLEAMRRVPENWDGYGALPPRPGPIDAAIGFLRHCYARMVLAEPYVTPTRSGGVLLEWERGPRQLEVEFDDPQCGSFVYLNRETGENATGTLFPARGGTTLQQQEAALFQRVEEHRAENDKP